MVDVPHRPPSSLFHHLFGCGLDLPLPIDHAGLCSLCDASQQVDFPSLSLCITCGLPTFRDESQRESDLTSLLCRHCYSLFDNRGSDESDYTLFDNRDSDESDFEDETDSCEILLSDDPTETLHHGELIFPRLAILS